MKYNLNHLKKHLLKIQSPERFQHSVGVMYTCSALAMKYEEDLEKSMLLAYFMIAESAWIALFQK